MGVIKRSVTFEIDDEGIREALIAYLQTEYTNLKAKNVGKIELDYRTGEGYRATIYMNNNKKTEE